MAYDETLADRVRGVLGTRDDVVEQRMFGGLAFMVAGHMACGVLGRDLIVRVGAEEGEEALAQPHVRPFDFTGRPSRGMVYVEPEAVTSEEDLRRWVATGLAFAAPEPNKK
jgi:TfoX/Sxy family transcriptional regulator of competence genes